jgi:hypothetical protein
MRPILLLKCVTYIRSSFTFVMKVAVLEPSTNRLGKTGLACTKSISGYPLTKLYNNALISPLPL